MITVTLPALVEDQLTLDSDEPTRGAHGTGGVPPLAGRVAVGGPYAVPVTPEFVAGDPGLRAFVEREMAQNVYHLVHLSLSFAAEPAAPALDQAAIELRLSAATAVCPPVAWSMTPLQITDSVNVERTFRLGPELKLEEAGLSLGSVERTVSGPRTEIFLQAQRELRSDPAWEFQRTRTMRLYGSHRLVMVIRAGKDDAVSISGTVRAATRGNLLRWYRRELPGPLPLTAVL
jgi:hypothetical protein